jgi:hypothetical protein
MNKFEYYTWIIKQMETVFRKVGLDWDDLDKHVGDEHNYYVLRCSEETLKSEADRLDYTLRFARFIDAGEFSEDCPAYADYNKEFYEAAMSNYGKSCFATYVERGKETMFRQVDRIRLQRGLVNSVVRFHKTAAHGLALPFVVHDKQVTHDICHDWLDMNLLKAQPLQKIRDYFGESVGFYFAFLEHLVHSLILPALVGLIATTIWAMMDVFPLEYEGPDEMYYPDMKRGQIGAWVGLFFSLFLVVWIVVSMEQWKRK